MSTPLEDVETLLQQEGPEELKEQREKEELEEQRGERSLRSETSQRSQRTEPEEPVEPEEPEEDRGARGARGAGGVRGAKAGPLLQATRRGSAVNGTAALRRWDVTGFVSRCGVLGELTGVICGFPMIDPYPGW